MRDIQISEVHVGDQVRVYSWTEPGLVEGVVREVYTTDLIVALGAATTVTFRPEHINRVVLMKRPEPEKREAKIRADEREGLAAYVEDIGRIAESPYGQLSDAQKARFLSAPGVLRHLRLPTEGSHADLADWLRGGAR